MWFSPLVPERWRAGVKAWMHRRREAWLDAGARRQSGARRDPRATVPVVVSLTTHGVRLARVHLAIETILRQTVRPERVVLWISDRLRAEDLTGPLRAQQTRGLEVRFVPDIGPYTKIIPALRAFPDRPILTVDDDSLYPRDLVARLHRAARAEPEHVHCVRAHYVLFDRAGSLRPYWEWRLRVDDIVAPSHRLFPTGVGGVIYAPGVLAPEVLNEAVFRSICPTADDIWLKAMALLAGSRARRLPGPHVEHPLASGTVESGLMEKNIFHGHNDRQLAAVLDHYGLRDRLRTD